MKQRFEAQAVPPDSQLWLEGTRDHRWLSGDVVRLAHTPEHPCTTYVHPAYAACEYPLKLNLFSFGKCRLHLPFTVVAPPISVDRAGFSGNLDALLCDYRRRRGLFLLLNLREEDLPAPGRVAVGNTLPGCVFENRFDSFAHYLSALRSHYRRRIKLACERGGALQVRPVPPGAFDQPLYQLYLQVLSRSDFPLETLPLRFFQQCGCHIDAFYHQDRPLAFVMYDIDTKDNQLDFLFGGMSYPHRDIFDLYQNMLLHLLAVGIRRQVRRINLGQTAETTKCRMGCILEPRYMIAFGGNRPATALLRLFAPLLQNNQKIIEHHVFKSD
ncbi:MAG: hypothetical protein WDA00_04175 [Eubacteriales bacterium]